MLRQISYKDNKCGLISKHFKRKISRCSTWEISALPLLERFERVFSVFDG